MPTPIHSAIYEGRVRHRRKSPKVNEFTYPMFMMYLDLDELPRLFEGQWFWSATRPALARFRREDYLGDPQTPLAEAVRDLVAQRCGRRPDGPVRLLTHLRYFGHQFNPVSFYYCYNTDGTTLEHIVAEIHNTPWGERFCYVLSEPDEIREDGIRAYRLGKVFHVSPFMPMEQRYAWRFLPPGEKMFVHMENYEGEQKLFDATLTLQRREISRGRLNALLVRYPLMTVKVMGWIYFQALRLWLKKVPFHTHPAERQPTVPHPLPQNPFGDSQDHGFDR